MMARLQADDDTFISKLLGKPERYEWQNSFVTPNPPGYYGEEGETYFITPGVQLGGGGGLTGMPLVVWQEGPFYIIKVPGAQGWCQIGDTVYRRTQYFLLELLKPHAADDRRPDVALRGDKWMFWGEGVPGRRWKRCLDNLKDHALLQLARRATS
jgi:hypothetical protein